MEVLLINTCDEWKSKSSMSLVGVITRDELNEKLFELITNGIVEVNAIDIFVEDTDEIDEEVLENFLENSSINDLNNGIDYLFIYEATIGEIETNGSYLY